MWVDPTLQIRPLPQSFPISHNVVWLSMHILLQYIQCVPDAFPHTIPTQLTKAASEPIHSSSSLTEALRSASRSAFSSCSQVAPSEERHMQSKRKNASFTSCLLLSKALSTAVVWMLRYVHTARQSRPTFGQTWALRWASVGWDCKKAAWGREEMECGGMTHDTHVCTLVPCAYTTNDSDVGQSRDE